MGRNITDRSERRHEALYFVQDFGVSGAICEIGYAVIRCALGAFALAIIVPGLVAFSLVAMYSDWISRRDNELAVVPEENSETSSVLLNRERPAFARLTVF